MFSRNNNIMVVVKPNCDGTSGTEWKYVVSCSDKPSLACDKNGACECSDGVTTTTPTATKPPLVNGCGSETTFPYLWPDKLLKFTPYYAGFHAACNTHDHCYGVCGQSKSDCDTTFQTDMAAACSEMPPVVVELCMTDALLFYQAVNLGGQGAFEDAQDYSCTCE
jgi:hypothetical protein